MTNTLLSIFPNSTDLLALEPEELAGVVLEIAPGVMQDEMFGIEALVAPLFPVVGGGYAVGLQRQVRIAVAEALAWLVNQSLMILDPDQLGRFYRVTRRAEPENQGRCRGISQRPYTPVRAPAVDLGREGLAAVSPR